jgi:hypothetical protein
MDDLRLNVPLRQLVADIEHAFRGHDQMQYTVFIAHGI